MVYRRVFAKIEPNDRSLKQRQKTLSHTSTTITLQPSNNVLCPLGSSCMKMTFFLPEIIGEISHNHRFPFDNDRRWLSGNYIACFLVQTSLNLAQIPLKTI